MEKEPEAETSRHLTDIVQVKKAEPEFEPTHVWLQHSSRGSYADPGGVSKPWGGPGADPSGLPDLLEMALGQGKNVGGRLSEARLAWHSDGSLALQLSMESLFWK